MKRDREALTSSTTNELYTPPQIAEPARVALGGHIWLDPCTTPEANEVIKAQAYMTGPDGAPRRTNDGLIARWWGTVFVNPPGGLLDRDTLLPLPRDENGRQIGRGVSSAAAWWFKMLEEYRARHITSGIYLCFRLDVLQTIQRLSTRHESGRYEPPHMYPFVIFEKRPKFWAPGTPPAQRGKVGRPTHAGAAFFLPPHHKPKCPGGWLCDCGVGESVLGFAQAFAPLGRVRV